MDKNAKRLTLLFSLILVVVPMVIFPARLGLPLLTGSAVYMMYELVYYGVVLYLFRRDVTLSALAVGSALTLVFRMALGAIFGLTIIIMYALDSSIAFSLGMTKYLPALILHIAAAPFVIRQFYLHLADNLSNDGSRKTSRIKRIEIEPTPIFEETTVPTASRVEDPAVARPAPVRSEHTPGGGQAESNQFERAVQYIGESGTVKLALTVDPEGLMLASFNRSGEDSEVWAPLGILLAQQNRTLLNQFSKTGDPTRIDIGMRRARLFVRCIEQVTLVVVTEENIDETIHIRIAQATDMVRKYMSERYSPVMFARAEERYVSDS